MAGLTWISVDTLQVAGRALDQPAAGRAAHAFDQQRGLAPVLADRRAEPRLERLAIEGQPFRSDGLGLRRIGLEGQLGAEGVVVAEAGVTNEFRDRLAAGAAHRPEGVVDGHPIAVARQHGFAAMEAELARGHAGYCDGGSASRASRR